jgi:CelD/BcsL family acetyltransferase involved in cellulose biosynthesis
MRADPAAEAASRPWRGLEAAASGLTSHPAWLDACVDAFGARRTVVLHAGPAERPAGVGLFERRGWGRCLRPLGEAELSEPADLLAVDDEAREEIAARAAEAGRALAFARLPAHSGTLGAVRRAWRRSGVVLVRPRPGTPRVAFDAGWTGPEAGLSSRRRGDLRRARRRAEEAGGLEVVVHAPHADTLAAPLAEALDVESRSWKGQVGAAILQDPLRGGFYQALAERAAAAGLLRLAVLRIGGRPAAMQFAAVCADAWWLLKVAYDPEFARCSPGQVLACETIAHAAAQGLSSYEFLGRPEPWTALWANQEAAVVSLVAYPWRPRGLALLAGRFARAAAVRLGRVVGGGGEVP